MIWTQKEIYSEHVGIHVQIYHHFSYWCYIYLMCPLVNWNNFSVPCKMNNETSLLNHLFCQKTDTGHKRMNKPLYLNYIILVPLLLVQDLLFSFFHFLLLFSAFLTQRLFLTKGSHMPLSRYTSELCRFSTSHLSTCPSLWYTQYISIMNLIIGSSSP
jgi:hypothetical protein